VRILTKYPRHPDVEYRVKAAATPGLAGFTYVKMFREGRREPTSSTIYNNENLPRWMIEGMQIIDLASDTLTGPRRAHIEGFGGVLADVYTFYKQKLLTDAKGD
jgi:hypothetical protein